MRRRSISARSETVSSRRRPAAWDPVTWRVRPARSRRQELDLAPEQVPERLVAGRLDEADREFERPDLDHVARDDRQILAAVDADERLVGVDDAADAGLPRGHHDRTEHSATQ